MGKEMDDPILDENWIAVVDLDMDADDFKRFIGIMRLLRTIYHFMWVVNNLIVAAMGTLIGLWVANIVPSIAWIAIALLCVAWGVQIEMRSKLRISFGHSYFHEDRLPEKLQVYYNLTRPGEPENYS